MSNWIRRLEEGVTAGALATVPMSGVMLVAQRVGLMGEQPPQKITNAALDAADITPTHRGRQLAALVAHVGFGASVGGVFSLLRPSRPTLGRAALEGAVFGTAVWAASYAGVIPKLGIMPSPEHDRPGRPSSMVVAHWVFGAVLGTIVAIRRSR